jgi:predicted DNA-binding transcriptional regulator YafY
VRKKRLRALHDIVHLQRCIERRVLAVIDYEKEKGALERGREIGPLLIFQSDGLYRLLALHNGIIKQYHLNKIVSLRPTEKQFKSIPAKDVEDLFRYSWRSWIGTERHAVTIAFSKEWMEWKNPRILMDTESVIERADGTAVITLTVNSLNEIATWIAGRGKGIVVLEPAALRDKVIELASGVIGNYQ